MDRLGQPAGWRSRPLKVPRSGRKDDHGTLLVGLFGFFWPGCAGYVTDDAGTIGWSTAPKELQDGYLRKSGELIFAPNQ